MGGCCAAIALGSIGCHCTVFEQTPGQLALQPQGAGLVIQPDMAAFLQRYTTIHAENVSFKSQGRQYVDRNGNVIHGNNQPQLFSAWDVLHAALRASVPDTKYVSGHKVVRVCVGGRQNNGTHSSSSSSSSSSSDSNSYTTGKSASIVTVPSAERSDTKIQETKHDNFELVVGADGPGSLVRRTFLPSAQCYSEYQGYVAWRGVLAEADTPPSVTSFLGQKFTVYQGPDFHILAYLIPGPNGEVGQGQKRLNWVWYWNEPDSERLGWILTDKIGKKHGYSVPRGLLNPQIANQMIETAKNVLPPPLAEMVAATGEEIFVQAIHDYLAPRLASGDDGWALVGDAGCILRPHTAAGTTKAAINAAALAVSLVEERGVRNKGGRRGVAAALDRYHTEMMQVGRTLVKIGVDIGTKSQFLSSSVSSSSHFS